MELYKFLFSSQKVKSFEKYLYFSKKKKKRLYSSRLLGDWVFSKNLYLEVRISSIKSITFF
jgi:hypothetical protein